MYIYYLEYLIGHTTNKYCLEYLIGYTKYLAFQIYSTYLRKIPYLLTFFNTMNLDKDIKNILFSSITESRSQNAAVG